MLNVLIATLSSSFAAPELALDRCALGLADPMSYPRSSAVLLVVGHPERTTPETCHQLAWKAESWEVVPPLPPGFALNQVSGEIKGAYDVRPDTSQQRIRYFQTREFRARRSDPNDPCFAKFADFVDPGPVPPPADPQDDVLFVPGLARGPEGVACADQPLLPISIPVDTQRTVILTYVDAFGVTGVATDTVDFHYVPQVKIQGDLSPVQFAIPAPAQLDVDQVTTQKRQVQVVGQADLYVFDDDADKWILVDEVIPLRDAEVHPDGTIVLSQPPRSGERTLVFRAVPPAGDEVTRRLTISTTDFAIDGLGGCRPAQASRARAPRRSGHVTAFFPHEKSVPLEQQVATVWVAPAGAFGGVGAIRWALDRDLRSCGIEAVFDARSGAIRGTLRWPDLLEAIDEHACDAQIVDGQDLQPLHAILKWGVFARDARNNGLRRDVELHVLRGPVRDVPESNGCGPADSELAQFLTAALPTVIAPSPLAALHIADFAPDCDQHDVCYSSCPDPEAYPGLDDLDMYSAHRFDCDEDLWVDTTSRCEDEFGGWEAALLTAGASQLLLASCERTSDVVFMGVRGMGSGPYAGDNQTCYDDGAWDEGGLDHDAPEVCHPRALPILNPGPGNGSLCDDEAAQDDLWDRFPLTMPLLDPLMEASDCD